MRWSRTALAARVQALSERFEGRDLVEALVSFADTLEPEDREALQAVLLERADQEHLYGAAVSRWAKEPKPSLFRRRRRDDA
jgi:hypothetical protein